jgi:inositol oxygenase
MLIKVGFVVMVADVVAERKVAGDPAELVLDGGFAMPDSNAFGQTFR